MVGEEDVLWMVPVLRWVESTLCPWEWKVIVVVVQLSLPHSSWCYLRQVDREVVVLGSWVWIGQVVVRLGCCEHDLVGLEGEGAALEMVKTCSLGNSRVRSDEFVSVVAKCSGLFLMHCPCLFLLIFTSEYSIPWLLDLVVC